MTADTITRIEFENKNMINNLTNKQTNIILRKLWDEMLINLFDKDDYETGSKKDQAISFILKNISSESMWIEMDYPYMIEETLKKTCEVYDKSKHFEKAIYTMDLLHIVISKIEKLDLIYEYNDFDFSNFSKLELENFKTYLDLIQEWTEEIVDMQINLDFIETTKTNIIGRFDNAMEEFYLLNSEYEKFIDKTKKTLPQE